MTPFERARRWAWFQDLARRWRKKPVDLVPFDEVRAALVLEPAGRDRLGEVLLDDIVGSCGRERDFNRLFFPRGGTRGGRWSAVLDLAMSPTGFPPVRLFKVGDVYFVYDGHHRVSVARALGAPSIEAKITEFRSPIGLTRHDSLPEIVLRASHAGFVRALGIDASAASDLQLSDPAAYGRLLEHISVHRWYRGIEERRPVSWQEAFASWKVNVYRRKVAAIDPPAGKTPGDAYLSLS